MSSRMGKPWSVQEEKTVYDLTVENYGTADIAEQIQRTRGAVRARQIRLGLRDRETRSLIQPFPPFNPFLDPIAVDMNDDGHLKNSDFATQGGNLPEDFYKTLERINEEPDLVQRLWLALEADADVIFGNQPYTNSSRNSTIFKSRVSPSITNGQTATLQYLGNLHGISGTRVGQIEKKGYKRLKAHIRRKRSWLYMVLNDFNNTLLIDGEHNPFDALSELLGNNTHSARFLAVILDSLKLTASIDGPKITSQTTDAPVRNKKLASVRTKCLTITCHNCGHIKAMHIAKIIPHMAPDARLSDLQGRLRCSSCKSRQIGKLVLGQEE